MSRTRVALDIFVLSLAIGIPSAPAAVKTTAINKTDLAAINTDLVNSPVEVEATIKSITPPHEGSRAPYRFELTDGTGTITLVIWTNLYETIKTQSPLSTGDVIHVNGTVTMYRDSLQLQIHDTGDLRVVTKAVTDVPASELKPSAPAAPAPAAEPKAAAPQSSTPPAAPSTTPLATITPDMVGKDVTVVATITEVHEPRSERAPYTVTLTQDDGHITLVYWSDMQPQLKDKIKAGIRVRINGQVSKYREMLQLKIHNAADVTVVTGS
jgi:DNA/RNA endonuclease YhcR with UshA esterase domain